MIKLETPRKDWKIKALQFGASIINSNVDKKIIEGEIPIKLCNYVDVYYNHIIDEDLDFMIGSATETEIEKFELKGGDVIITKDSESADDIGIPAYVEKDMEGVVCGYHLAVFKPFKEQLNGKFLLHYLNSKIAQTFFELGANGVTRFGLSRNAIKTLPVPYPSISEQTQIANFLDQKTAQIDGLIAQKEKLIQLLSEKRTALITQAVTKGLDPNVEMKDSGVDWLGEIPKHWEVKKIKYLSPVSRGASPRPIADPKYFDENGEFSWVRIADVTASHHYLRETTQTLSELGASLSVKMHPGSLFLSIAGSVGKPMITKIKCCIHDGFVYFPRLKINNEFLYRIFESEQPYKGLGKMGTQLNLNTDTVGDISIGLPNSSTEIDNILEYLNVKLKQFDDLIFNLNKSVDLLKEYREALITAAVTGQIKV